MPARTILQVFKTIALAMLLVFVWDIAIYLYKAYQLNQRIESLAVSMQRTVEQNDYLPESEYNAYTTIFDQIVNTLNGTNNNDRRVGRETRSDESFIALHDNDGTELGGGIRLNYDSANIHRANGLVHGLTANDKIDINTGSSTDTIFDPSTASGVNLATPTEYGNLKYIQISVTLNQPIWGFAGGQKGITAQSGNGQLMSSDQWTDNSRANGLGLAHPQVTLYYSYLVPCLHYNAIT